MGEMGCKARTRLAGEVRKMDGMIDLIQYNPSEASELKNGLNCDRLQFFTATRQDVRHCKRYVGYQSQSANEVEYSHN